ncbi:MAG: FKBP-type peptidyl-prolyl cis-trans isomerase [Polaribacter sp.]
MKSYFSLFFICVLLTSCLTPIPEVEEEIIDYDPLNETEIQEYITKNNLSPQKSESGLYYIIKKEGTGKAATLNTNVTVYYRGYTTTNTDIFFDESPVSGTNFDLRNLIKGFAEGVTYLKEGGEATLIIPSKIGYNQINSLPNNPLIGKVLLYDIKLIRVY